MQDYSRLQYQILKKMFPCRMTILGDKAQTMEEKEQDVLGFLPEDLWKRNPQNRDEQKLPQHCGNCFLRQSPGRDHRYGSV